MNDREEKLRQRIRCLESVNDDRKWMRTKKTLFVLSPIVYLIVFMCDVMNCARDYLLWIIGAPMAAGLIIFISVLVTLYMSHGAMRDEKEIAKLQGELNAIQSTREE